MHGSPAPPPERGTSFAAQGQLMETSLEGKAKRVRIYLSEGDHVGHKPAHVAIVEFLHNANCAGATVFRGVEGFGEAGEMHTGSLVDVVPRLPLVVEWVDSAERVDRLLERVKGMVVRGLITVEDIHVALYAPHSLRRVSRLISAGEAMSREVVSVARGDPVARVVELLLGKSYRAVPVVENGVPVGIITNSDLVNRGGLGARMELLPSLNPAEFQAELARLAQNHKVAGDIMTPAPVTVHAATPLPQVADVMAHRRLKRLPVTDDQGRLAGVISRVDLLRTVAEGFAGEAAERADVGLNGDMPIARVMRQDVPTVHPDTPVGEVMQAVVSTRLNRAVVVDQARRVVGIVTDAELLDRVTPSLRPGALRSLMHRLPFMRQAAAEMAAEQHAEARAAKDLMSTDVLTAAEEMPLRQAIAAMLQGKYKLAAVVDGERRLVGIVDRADALRGLVQPP
jgi:CBS domain-containing protein